MRKLGAIIVCGLISFLTLASGNVYAQGSDSTSSQSPTYYAGPTSTPTAPVVSADSSSLRPENPDAVFMGVDLLTRPVLAAIAVLGLGAYILSLPFSYLGGNMEQARQQLVVVPFQSAFTRCLGCYGSMDTGEFLNTTN